MKKKNIMHFGAGSTQYGVFMGEQSVFSCMCVCVFLISKTDCKYCLDKILTLTTCLVSTAVLPATNAAGMQIRTGSQLGFLSHTTTLLKGSRLLFLRFTSIRFTPHVCTFKKYRRLSWRLGWTQTPRSAGYKPQWLGSDQYYHTKLPYLRTLISCLSFL